MEAVFGPVRRNRLATVCYPQAPYHHHEHGFITAIMETKFACLQPATLITDAFDPAKDLLQQLRGTEGVPGQLKPIASTYTRDRHNRREIDLSATRANGQKEMEAEREGKEER